MEEILAGFSDMQLCYANRIHRLILRKRSASCYATLAYAGALQPTSSVQGMCSPFYIGFES